MIHEEISEAARSIGVLLLYSGWVRNRMGGSSAPLSREGSVGGMIARLDRYAWNLSGAFVRFDGTRMPW